jgi:hypothetical protein
MKALCSISLMILMCGCAGGVSSPAKEAHSPAPPGARQLSGAEITSQFIGRSHTSVTTSGASFSETLMQDGTARIQITGSPEKTGQWSITGDVLCVNYVAYGKECNIVKADDKYVWFVDSTKGTTNNSFTK